MVSQWGLNGKIKGRTSPEHSMVVSQWSLSEHKAQRSLVSQESRPTAKAGPSRNFALKAKQLSSWPARVEGSITRIRPSMPKPTDVGEKM